MKKILLLLASAILITLVMPMRGWLSLSYTEGEKWNEPTILAPFDIPIAKSDAEIDADRRLLSEGFVPMLRLDTTGVHLFEQDSLIYQSILKGVISSQDREKYATNPVRVLHGAKTYTLPAKELATPEEITQQTTLKNFPQNTINQISTNLIYDEKLNNVAREQYLSNLSLTKGLLRAGEVIVANDQIIDIPTRQLLDSYVIEYEKRMGSQKNVWWMVVARFLLVVIILGINLIFFNQFASHYFGDSIRPILFTFSLYVLMTMLVAFADRLPFVNQYIIPLPVVAIYLLTFFNMRVAILGNITIVLICALFVKLPFDYVLLNFAGGMTAIFMLRHMYHRTDLFQAVGVVFAVEVAMLTLLSLLDHEPLSMQYLYNGFYLLVGIVLMLAFYQLIYVVEKLFGFTSELTLLELSDTNQKLLLNLAQQAPGTFQHSVQVANLAESAAKSIGANPLLARCGALYHDIGKMKNPFYFVENLSGTFNPHDDVTPDKSAEIIRRHVTDGVETARKAKIPQVVIDFIERHHGNSMIYYFYVKARELDPETNPDTFRYPGANPVTKEVSICMMADAVEAASRSLPSYDKEPLERLVDSIIDKQIAEGMFKGSQLTFSEVEQVREVFKAKLNTIYHGRIAYPARR